MVKVNKDRVRVTESKCLNCGKLMDALGTGDRNIEAKPEPDDIAICIKCGAVMKLDDSLRLRGMTKSEMDELVADKEWMNQIARIVRGIHFIKHTIN
jgi:hypothetical protein